jgi:hypothetical protein
VHCRWNSTQTGMRLLERRDAQGTNPERHEWPRSGAAPVHGQHRCIMAGETVACLLLHSVLWHVSPTCQVGLLTGGCVRDVPKCSCLVFATTWRSHRHRWNRNLDDHESKGRGHPAVKPASGSVTACYATSVALQPRRGPLVSLIGVGASLELQLNSWSGRLQQEGS